DEPERPESLHSQLPEDWDADLDYVLALSLQNENNPHHNTAADIPRDFWEYDCTKESGQSAHLEDVILPSLADKEMIMLPCEFCEELCPAEDLILHQTGCNPASAFASFSKRSSSPNPWEYSDLQAGGSSSHRTVPLPQPQAVQAEGDIMIPCEFCGIQLEEEILFHHQLRPASPTGDIPARELPAPQPRGDRRESPEPARRRIRHQGV
ncbi:TRAD1 protein, partial [Pomatorhinus ruficollis]|nr:TRAD1 protein [Pomatorhinus ruficollis]